MNVFIALYHGINVGGKNAVKMEALRAMHERLGHRNVQSYIQSGNLVFTAKGAAAGIARKTATKFLDEFGFAAKILVVDADRWRKIVDENPYAKFAASDPKSVHMALCESKPSETGLQALLTKSGGAEKFTIGENMLYLHAPAGFGTSKFAAGMERASGVSMTVRNWRTVEALWTLVSESR